MKTENSTLSESLSAIACPGIDGIALDAVISGNPARLAAARRALNEAAIEFSASCATMELAARRNMEAQIASASSILK